MSTTKRNTPVIAVNSGGAKIYRIAIYMHLILSILHRNFIGIHKTK